jgi:hypothetical protein
MKKKPTQRVFSTAKLKTKAVVKKPTKKDFPNNKNKGGLAESLSDAMAGISKSFSRYEKFESERSDCHEHGRLSGSYLTRGKIRNQLLSTLSSTEEKLKELFRNAGLDWPTDSKLKELAMQARNKNTSVVIQVYSHAIEARSASKRASKINTDDLVGFGEELVELGRQLGQIERLVALISVKQMKEVFEAREKWRSDASRDGNKHTKFDVNTLAAYGSGYIKSLTAKTSQNLVSLFNKSDFRDRSRLLSSGRVKSFYESKRGT